MAWIKFTKAHDWDVPEYEGRVTKAFVEGDVFNAPHDFAEEMKTAGLAVEHVPEKLGETDDGKANRRG